MKCAPDRIKKVLLKNFQKWQLVRQADGCMSNILHWIRQVCPDVLSDVFKHVTIPFDAAGAAQRDKKDTFTHTFDKYSGVQKFETTSKKKTFFICLKFLLETFI